MTPSDFARELVSRLAEILPPGFAARAEAGNIHIDSPDGMGSATSLAHIDPEDAEAEDYASAAWNVLSMAQDVVSETSGDPWPAAVGPSRDLAAPDTRVDDDAIHLWFGDEGAPVVRLAPIPLRR
jgi:hypothetical protein